VQITSYIFVLHNYSRLNTLPKSHFGAATNGYIDEGVRLLELAQKAVFLYEKQEM